MNETNGLSNWDIYYPKMCKIEQQARFLLECGEWGLEWMAEQIDENKTPFGIAFLRGRSHAHVNYEDMDKDIDVLAMDCAKQLLGFAVNSEQDKQRKREWYRGKIEASKRRIESEKAIILRLENSLESVGKESDGE